VKSTSLGRVIGLIVAGCSATPSGPPSASVEPSSTGGGSANAPPAGGGGSGNDAAAAPGGDTADAGSSTIKQPGPPASAGPTSGQSADAGSPVPISDAAGADSHAPAVDASHPADSGAVAISTWDSGPITVPVSDPTSTLGISAAGAGYHVEGNIPYGPAVMERLDVIYPTSAGPKGTTTLPGVIMFHGGGWTDARPQALKASMSSFYDRFLQHGFLVCNVEYRLADGTANGAIAPAADQDALLAAKWFWDHFDYYHVDKTKYVVTGASAGGQLALMVGMATPAAQLGPTSPADFKIAAIVNGYGPADATDLLAKNVSWAVQWLPASVPNRAALAMQVSPVTYVSKNVPPLITVQGDMDHTVPMTESQNLYDLLTAAGAVTALHFVAGAGHGFDSPATAWPDAEATMFAFLTAQGL
jgi:acetyl esterase/lipase